MDVLNLPTNRFQEIKIIAKVSQNFNLI